MRLSARLEGGGSLARFGELPPAAEREAVTRAALEVRNEIQVNLNGRILPRRTGALARSWARMPEIKTGESGTTAELASNLTYAAIHEYGGVIRPVRAKNLTIPLEAALAGSGRLRFRAREVIESPEAYGFARTFVSRSGKAIMGVRPGKRRRDPVPLFALAKKVIIPAKHYASDAIRRVTARLPELVKAAALDAARSLGLLS